ARESLGGRQEERTTKDTESTKPEPDLIFVSLRVLCALCGALCSISITAQNVSKRFGDFVALDGVSVECPAGQLVALLGPSGSGKTTVLRIIAGLEGPDSGTVLFKDDDITARSAKDRNVGFVFQHYALFRHM